VARYLQDIGSDDWDDVGAGTELTWVVRRSAFRLAEGGRWPSLGEWVSLSTWCGGTGAAWAERRTNISIDDQVLIETASLWVPVNAAGQPQRIPSYFLDYYGAASKGRKVSGKVTRSLPPDDAHARSWPLRRSDLDIVDHVNNAAIWQAVTEVVPSRVSYAELTFHGPVLASDLLSLATSAGQVWLLSGDDVRVSGEFT
jgi:acyl-ACP thioesterase